MFTTLLAFSGGGLLIVYRGSIFVAMVYKLAPAYVGASAGSQSSLAIVGDTPLMFDLVADFIGAALVAGIGLPILCIAILRTALAPRWVAWLGLFAAIAGGWITLLRPVSEVFEIIELVGGLSFFVWMVVMGVVLWRAPEPVST